ncbi:TPA: hypothetical protein R1698_000391 [Campylobacter lari]|uniref:hypothetical protein n=1 Tax=Campylobacter sp. FU_497 TaxID=2911610 RepID=UPI0021E63C3F|nr:hypothetical protein [Campylobacter sp. FU_497]MCV3462666.1 hypothetical protein [Campylobacter sp. FU_497]HEC1758800.1 hypothetical protein [Campylobacter lari]
MENNSKNNIYLCSFADTRLGTSIYRFKLQAEAMNVFDDIIIHTEASLPLDFKNYFKDKFYTKDKKITRGFGYWCWKPKVILMTLEQMQENDILLYLDIGFTFNPKKRKQLLEDLDFINENEIVGMQVKSIEKEYQKMDTLVFYGLHNNEKFLNSFTYGAGFIGIKKTTQNIKIIQEWMDVYYQHWNFIDDSPSRLQNFTCFKESRHDQSIWNILREKYSIAFVHGKGYHIGEKAVLCAREKIFFPNTSEEMEQIKDMIRKRDFFGYKYVYNLRKLKKRLFKKI